MSIAYIVDSSYDIERFKHLKNVHIIPFKKVVGNGNFEKVYSHKEVITLQNMPGRSIIEPTPGEYRDLIQKLKQQYTEIVCIPQSNLTSNSYLFCNYAKSIISDNKGIEVVDINRYQKGIEEQNMNLMDMINEVITKISSIANFNSYIKQNAL